MRKRAINTCGTFLKARVARAAATTILHHLATRFLRAYFREASNFRRALASWVVRVSRVLACFSSSFLLRRDSSQSRSSCASRDLVSDGRKRLVYAGQTVFFNLIKFQKWTKWNKEKKNLVVLFRYSDMPPSLASMNSLGQQCHPVPLKIALVDGGNILFYSILDVDSPTFITRG